MRTTEIIDPNRNISLKASAGSGKTFNLSLRVVNLFLSGVEPERVLCLTFTNKATNEMYERIIGLLRYLAFELSPGNIRNEAGYLLIAGKDEDGDPDLSARAFGDDEILDLRSRAAEVYHRVVENISRLRISTIDSFLNSILRLFPFEAGVMPDFRILTERTSEKLYLEAFDHFIRDISGDREMKDLLSELIIKSGKAISSPSTFLYPFFNRLFESRVGVERMVRERFPGGNDADTVGKIAGRLGALGEKDVSIRIKARTFAKLVRENFPGLSARGLGELNKYSEYDTEGIAGLTSISRESFNEYLYFKKCGPHQGAQKIFNEIRGELPGYFRLKGAVFIEALLFLFSGFAAYLDRAKEKKKGLSFSDVTNTCYRLLVDGGLLDQTPDYFYFRLDSRIEHLLIDEFQDTNFIQWLILKPFVDELTSGLGQKDRQGSFFYVGDPKQSIYRFRGGESRLFDKVLRQYEGKIRPELLGKNFRSSRAIVQFVNEVFAAIGQTIEYGYEPQEICRQESEGIVEAVFIGKETLKEDPLVKKERVLSWIGLLTGNGVRPEEITLLCGENRECEEYARYLNERGIDAVTESSMTFLSSPGVDAVLQFLHYLNDTRQGIYLFNFILSVPGLLTAGEKNRALVEKSIPDRITESIGKISRLEGLVPASSLIRAAIDEFGLFSRFGDDPNIALLIDTASSPECDDPVSLDRFLDFIEEDLRDTRAAQREAVHAVKVLTIHKAKGLEFPYVILPELEIDLSVSARETRLIYEYDEDLFINNIYLNESRNRIPYNPDLARAVERERELVMQDRLNQLYVALTRAKEGLFLIAAQVEKEEEAPGKLSDVISMVLGGEDYRAGALAFVPNGQRSEKRAPEPFSDLGRTLDFIGSRRKPVSTAGDLPEQYETSSFSNYRARRIGVAFHYGVQVLEGFDMDSARTAIGRIREFFGFELSPEELDSIGKRLSMLIQDVKFRKLAGSSRLLKEAPLVQGERVFIPDLIALGEEQVTVVDFKTRRDEGVSERYRTQVERYCDIVSQIFNLRCCGYVCFVLENSVEYTEI